MKEVDQMRKTYLTFQVKEASLTFSGSDKPPTLTLCNAPSDNQKTSYIRGFYFYLCSVGDSGNNLNPEKELGFFVQILNPDTFMGVVTRNGVVITPPFYFARTGEGGFTNAPYPPAAAASAQMVNERISNFFGSVRKKEGEGENSISIKIPEPLNTLGDLINRVMMNQGKIGCVCFPPDSEFGMIIEGLIEELYRPNTEPARSIKDSIKAVVIPGLLYLIIRLRLLRKRLPQRMAQPESK